MFRLGNLRRELDDVYAHQIHLVVTCIHSLYK